MTEVRFDKRCFVISPIGEEGSDDRKHADEVFESLVYPAMRECGIEPIRSDHLNYPGRISEQMFRAILDYDFCVAVLTGHNPNVFYELAVAQAAKRPVVLLIKSGQGLPFDIKDLRCITYDLDNRSLQERTHIAQLVKFVEAIKAANWKTPDIFAPFSEVSAAQQAANSFSDRVKGEWWECITVDDRYSLGHFQIKLEELYNSVQMEGRVYDAEGILEAHWRSTAAAVDTGDRKIIYVRKCRNPNRANEEWYHGFGEMEFENSERPHRGSGRFCDVERTPLGRPVVRPVALRRVTEDEGSMMSTDIDVQPLIVKILKSFPKANAQRKPWWQLWR
jgi:hypothetical protein